MTDPVDGDDTVELASSTRRIVTNDPNYPKPQSVVDEEIGVRFELPFLNQYKNMWEVLRTDDVSIEKLKSMRSTDGQAIALFRLMTLPILASLKHASIIPYPYESGGEEEVEFIEKMFNTPSISGGMQTPFPEFVRQALLSIFDGFSAFEIVIQNPKVGPLKGKWTLKKLAYRPAETITFLIDDKGDWTGLRQRTQVNGKVIDEFIERNRAIYVAMNEDQKPYYGLSFFHAAFFHWDKKVRLYYLAHLMAQRSAVGTRIGKYPKTGDPKEIADFGKQLANMGTNNWMRVPEDYIIESLKEGGSFDFLGLINHHDNQMAKSVLASFLDQNKGAGQNDQTLVDFSQESDALFILLLESIIYKIETVINNEVIPRFIVWNFGTDKYPQFKFGPVTKDQRNIILKMFQTLATASNQGNMSPDFAFNLEKIVAEELGLGIDYEEVEKEREEQKAAEKEQQDQLQAADEFAQTPAGQEAAAPATAVPGASPAEGGLDIPPDLLPPGM